MTGEPSREPRRWLWRCSALAWAGWLLSLGLLWGEHRARVLHPPSLLFIFLLALTLGSAVAAVGVGLWRLRAGPGRLVTLGLLVVTLVPVLVWAALGWYAYRNGQEAQVPRNLAMTLMMRAGDSMMEAQAAYLYAHRMESQRLVMFYRDGLADPQGDLRAMDRQVAEMQERTGLRLRARIYWARGPLLGRQGLCCFGIAAASDESPAGVLDAHELAHALMNQQSTTATQPPTLLSEGWAVSQSQPLDPANLAAAAWSLRERMAELSKSPESQWEHGLPGYADEAGMTRLLRRLYAPGHQGDSWLRELTDDYWYHHDRGPVYEVGGAFVNFLLRKYGGGRFVQFYLASRPGSFEADCQNILGVRVDDLEKEFWNDAERLIGEPRPGQLRAGTRG